MNRRHFIRGGLLTGLLSPAIITSSPARSAPGYQEPGLPIRLDSNENPLGISNNVREAIQRQLAQAARYPFSFESQLIDAITLRYGIDRECIVLGAGSSEVLQMAVQAFCDSDSLFLSSTPTFEVAEKVARSQGVQVARVSLTRDYLHDLDELRRQSFRHRGNVLVYLCNPNNPTGTLTPTGKIEEWIATAPDNTLFLVDEAYHEYVDDASYYSLLNQAETRDNLIVTRSFSKIYALAGLRIGYGVANPALSDRIAPFASAGSVNTLGVFAATAALKDQEFVEQGLKTNSDAREIFYTCLRRLELPFLPSNTNFVMFHVPGELKTFIARMSEAGIDTGRPFPPLIQHCRISIGLPEQMEYVGEVLGNFRKRRWI